MPAQIRVCGGSHGYSRQGTMKTPGNQCNPPESESFAAAAVQVIISGFTPPGPRQKAWFSKADGGTPQPAGDAGNVERREESRAHGDEATCVVHSLAMPPAVVSIAVRCWSWGTTFTAGSVWRGSGRESVTDARTAIRAASPPPDHRGLPFRCSRSRTTGWSRLVWWEFQRESSGQAWSMAMPTIRPAMDSSSMHGTTDVRRHRRPGMASRPVLIGVPGWRRGNDQALGSVSGNHRRDQSPVRP